MNLVPPPPPQSHRFWPGDWVYVKRRRTKPLELKWTGPYVILLTTLTTLKVHSIATWVHYSHARPSNPFTLKEDYQGNGWETSRNPRNHPFKLCVIGSGNHLPPNCSSATSSQKSLRVPWRLTWVITSENGDQIHAASTEALHDNW